MNWLDTIVQGVLLGGLYALFAAGLSLVFGIMRLVNLAHGDLIVLAAYLILVIVSALGISPFLALVIAIPVMFAIGWALQFVVLNRTLGEDISCRRSSSPSGSRSSSRTRSSRRSRRTAGGSAPGRSRPPRSPSARSMSG
jgi:hypothetical protein